MNGKCAAIFGLSVVSASSILAYAATHRQHPGPAPVAPPVVSRFQMQSMPGGQCLVMDTVTGEVWAWEFKGPGVSGRVYDTDGFFDNKLRPAPPKP